MRLDMMRTSIHWRVLVILALAPAYRGLAEDVAPTASTQTVPASTTTLAPAAPVTPIPVNPNRHALHGIHLTATAAGSKRYRQNQLEKMLTETMINMVVVDIKEEDGHVYVPGVKMAERAGAYVRDIPDLESWLAELKKRGVYTVARIVCFKDNIMPRREPALGVHNVNGELWHDRKHMTWLDPYNHDAWRYIHLVSLRCAEVGFDEVQYDYIRFPTDGILSQMRFKRPYSRQAASQALVDFLREGAQLLHPRGMKMSIDVFGLVTSVTTGMGIGQVMEPMSAQVDYVCPMTYPSHYARGEYGLANPNDQPYRTIHMAMRDAIKSLGPEGAIKLRPYLQDFSLKGRGIRYGAREVRAQIQAAADMGVVDWTLWNARCVYTLPALTEPIQTSTGTYQIQASTH
jgi:hypothetical protein